MDYRRVDEQNAYENVLDKKKVLIKKFSKHVKNHYDQIKKRDQPYNFEFLKIYNVSCVYCGITELLVSRNMWEIDHFICESSFKTIKNGKDAIDHINAGNINNLVLACFVCNRKKSGYIISQELANILNIDNNDIANVFYRDKDSFRILINEKYKRDQEVVNFYQKLNLGSDLKRLEYLVLKIDNIIQKQNLSDENKIVLNDILNILIKKHNLTYGI